MRAFVMTAVFAIAVLSGAGVAEAAQSPARSGLWRITKSEWSDADEKGFADFVTAIGQSGCDSTESCIRSTANPYRVTDPKNLQFSADCADLPYMLRAYYAWKNDLPFAYVDNVSGKGDDIRYTSGNKPRSRRDLVDHGHGLNGPKILNDIHDDVSSATYRTNAAEDSGVLSDFYSPKLQPGAIGPGTAIYDVNGHVGIVYAMEPDGRIDYMDAHPDFSVTRSVYGAQFGQSPVRLGGGFKNWRPMKLAGAKRDDDGHLIGGHIVLESNAALPDFSLEQYTGNVEGTSGDGENARFRYNNVELGFFEYVRASVSGGQYVYNPVYELRSTIRTLCNDLKDRALYVNMAVKDGIDRKAQPAHMPENIYNADDNEWETYSTPSRDARVKTAFAQFYIDLRKMIFFWEQRDPRIVYDGISLKDDLRKMYAEETAACSISYTNSSGAEVALGFDDIAARLFVLDFDPYHCIERRWGASGAELSTCGDGKVKTRWYNAEQRLRYQTDRTYDATMGFSVVQLENKADNSGADAPPTVDIKALIDGIGNRTVFVGMKPIGH